MKLCLYNICTVENNCSCWTKQRFTWYGYTINMYYASCKSLFLKLSDLISDLVIEFKALFRWQVSHLWWDEAVGNWTWNRNTLFNWFKCTVSLYSAISNSHSSLHRNNSIRYSVPKLIKNLIKHTLERNINICKTKLWLGLGKKPYERF